MSTALPNREDVDHRSKSSLFSGNGLQPTRLVTTTCAYKSPPDSDTDGIASLELNPYLAHDASGSIKEARRLWAELDCPNAFIKVPATDAGLTVITQLVSEGIKVNVTLLFSLQRYQQVLEAYLAGIEARLAQGKSVRRVASIASLSASAIDALADPLLEKFIEQDAEPADLAEEIQGRISGAIATLAYQMNRQTFDGDRFQRLTKEGARVQKLSAQFNHGESRPPLDLDDKDIEQAHWILKCLPKLGIDINVVARQLGNEAINARKEIYDKSIATLDIVAFTASKQPQPKRLTA